MAVWNTIKRSDIESDRFDAEYFRKDFQDNIQLLNKTGETFFLGSLFKYIYRGTQPLYNESGTIKALRSVNVGFMNFNETRQEFVTTNFFENSSRGKVQKDDILITSTGIGTLGRTSIWFKNENAFGDGHITILRNGVVDPYCIVAFLNSKYGLAQFDQNYRGSSGQIEIYPFDISKFIIPECLLESQIEIGNCLKEAFEYQTKSIEQYELSTKLLEKELGISNFHKDQSQYRITSFLDVIKTKRLDAQCYKPEYLQYEVFIRNNKKFDLLSNLLSSISKGNQQDIDNCGKYPYVSIKDISGIDVISKANVNKPFSMGKFEELLLAVTGATIGKIGIIHRYNTLSFSGDILCLSVNKNKISPWYLLGILSSPIGQTQFNRWITGSTNGHLNPADVRKVIIPRMNIDKEIQVGEYLKKSIEYLVKSENLLSEAKFRVEQLIEEAANK